jgi:hypothetical protein
MAPVGALPLYSEDTVEELRLAVLYHSWPRIG